MTGLHQTTKGERRLTIYTSLSPSDLAYLQSGITAVLRDWMNKDVTPQGRDGAAYLLTLLEDTLPGELEMPDFPED